MKFYLAEMEAFENLYAAETLADIVRIGFNRVNFRTKDGKYYECWEMINNNTVEAHGRDKDGNYITEPLNGDIMIDRDSIDKDTDEDGYTIINVREF